MSLKDAVMKVVGKMREAARVGGEHGSSLSGFAMALEAACDAAPSPAADPGVVLLPRAVELAKRKEARMAEIEESVNFSTAVIKEDDGSVTQFPITAIPQGAFVPVGDKVYQLLGKELVFSKDQTDRLHDHLRKKGETEKRLVS